MGSKFHSWHGYKTRYEVLTTKVDKDEEVWQCVEALQDINVILAVMDTKYDQKLLVIPNKEEHEDSHHNKMNQNGLLQSPIVRLGFPKFSGGEPTSWIYWASQFFQYQKTAKEQEVILAFFHLEREVMHWQWWYKKTQTELTRSMLQKAICVHFESTEYEDEALSRN